jgi:hypothetical protein
MPMKPSRQIAMESVGRHPSIFAEGLDHAETIQVVCRASSAAGEKSGARELTLPDPVFTRLELTAIKRGSAASAIAAEILERNLPRLRIAVDD